MAAEVQEGLGSEAYAIWDGDPQLGCISCVAGYRDQLLGPAYALSSWRVANVPTNAAVVRNAATAQGRRMAARTAAWLQGRLLKCGRRYRR